MPQVRRARLIGILVLAAAAVCAAAASEPTRVKPGINFFTPAGDVELGRASAAEAERQLPILHDPAVDAYVSAVGKRLAAAAPGAKYPYQFEVINLSEGNAFSLPGGFLYISRGMLEFVSTEGQLAGVLAHEIAHVALRHGTNQVTKANMTRAIFGAPAHGIGIMRKLGGVGLNVLFLKFSRTAEEQADVVGAQIMAAAGYDPREMAEEFERERKQEARQPGLLRRFLSDHPATADREARVRKEITRLRVAPAPAVGNLAAVQAELRRLPPAATQQAAQTNPPGNAPSTVLPIRIDPPSTTFRTFRHRSGLFQIAYPENWEVGENSTGFGAVIAPSGGILKTADGSPSFICGVMLNHYDPLESRAEPGNAPVTLETGIEDLVHTLTLANPGLRPVAGTERRGFIAGRQGLSVVLSGNSPAIGQESRILVVTRELTDGHLLYALFASPGRLYAGLSSVFEKMILSLQVDDRVPHR
jgi:Zn-dependent protease with chaperone function